MGVSTATERPERTGRPRDHAGPTWRWPVARQIALTRAGWACEICGLTDWHVLIEVHHVTLVDNYRPGSQHDPDGLVALCVPHHREVHRAARSGHPYQIPLFVAA